MSEEKKIDLGQGSSKVTLVKTGDKKIGVIKLIREFTSVGLKEAKDMADGAPFILIKNISADGAKIFGEALRNAGADVDYGSTYNIELADKIKKLLIEQNKKLSCSDIDSFLLHQNLDEIKFMCEEMYRKGEISFAGNGRYFSPLNSHKEDIEDTKLSESSKSEIDIEAELLKYKKLFDKGLITKDAYEAKMNKILDI